MNTVQSWDSFYEWGYFEHFTFVFGVPLLELFEVAVFTRGVREVSLGEPCLENGAAFKAFIE